MHGADFHYLTTSGNWNINGQFIYSDIDEEGDGTGFLNIEVKHDHTAGACWRVNDR